MKTWKEICNIREHWKSRCDKEADEEIITREVIIGIARLWNHGFNMGFREAEKVYTVDEKCKWTYSVATDRTTASCTGQSVMTNDGKYCRYCGKEIE